MALIDEDYLRISLRTEAFRISFEEPFRVVFGLAVVGAVCWFISQGNTQFVFLGLVVPLITGILSAIGIEFLRRRYLFTVGPAGLNCYNFWGFKRTIPWESMHSVRQFQVFGLGYLRIRSDQLRSDIWLPLFVDRHALLIDLVGAHVDDQHPLMMQLKRIEA